MKEKRRRTLAGKLLFIISIVIAVCTALGISASYISPAKIWFPAFFGLMFLYLYPLNFLFVVYYALRWRNHIIIPLIPCIAGFHIFSQSFNLTSSEKKEKPEGIKLMTYNVRLFDLYNWSHNYQTRAKIFDYFIQEAPDIACFQEYYTEDADFRNTDTLVKILKTPYYATKFTTNEVNNTRHWGIIIFSKYPIVGSGQITFGDKASNACVYADIKVNNDTVRVYNAHLESMRFKKPDYDYVEGIKENIEEKKLSGLRRIYSRIKKAFIKRAEETQMLTDSMKNCPYPIIFCGDFNDPPASYTYHTFSNFLEDAFKTGGPGFAATYNGPFPAFRIDYILHSPAITASDFHVVRNNLSDHYPVISYLKTGEQ